MSAIFNRNPYAPRSRFLPRQGTVMMFGAAFVAGIACTVALSHYAPRQATPNPWGPETAKPAPVSRAAPPAAAAVPSTQAATAVPTSQAAAAPASQTAAAPAPKAAAPVRMIAADKVTPAPRPSDRNVGVIVARDDSEDAKPQPARSAPPPRLNDYEREALAKAAAAKANAELAGGPVRTNAAPASAAPASVAEATTTQADDEAKRAHEAAEKARKAKARKAARERQLARARAQEQWRGQDYQYYGYPNRNQMFAQEYSYGRSMPYFRPGGIW